MPDLRMEFGKKLIADDPNISDADLAAALKVFDAQSASSSTPEKPGVLSTLGKMLGPGEIPQFTGLRVAGRLIKEHPAQAGAIAGGLAAVPLTGGASVPAAMAAAGLGAAGGAGVGLTAKQLATGRPESGTDTAKTMATEGALGALGEGAGRVVGSGLRLLGRGAYRVALAPTQKILGKYGDVVGEGLETATPVSKAGLQQATAIKGARMAAKDAALTAADQRVSYLPQAIADDASLKLSDYAAKQIRAGLDDPTAALAERLAKFKAANPKGTLTPSSLNEVQGTLNDQAGGAFRKIRAKEPLTTDEKGTVEMLGAMNRTQEQAVPGFRAMNRGVMDAEGLRQAIQRRTLGSGGNQVLDTLLTLMRGKAGIPGRIAMMPPVLSHAGIGAYKAAPAASATLRAALIAALGGEE